MFFSYFPIFSKSILKSSFALMRNSNPNLMCSVTHAHQGRIFSCRNSSQIF